jgi:tetratricopeptide (TPR) repeat protein
MKRVVAAPGRCEAIVLRTALLTFVAWSCLAGGPALAADPPQSAPGSCLLAEGGDPDAAEECTGSAWRARARHRALGAATIKTGPLSRRPALSAARDAPPPPRTSAQRVRDRRLLLQEIRTVEQVLAVTPRRARDRHRVLRQLSDAYIELAELAERDARQSGTAAKADARKVRFAWQRAATHLELLVDDHPRSCRFPRRPVEARGCGDEALLLLARSALRLDRTRDAARAYQRLVDEWPASTWVPYAELAMGEIAFHHGKGHARWQQAARAYLRVIEHPRARPLFVAYAHYKLAHVRYNGGDLGRALKGFRRTIELAARGSDARMARVLAAARRDVVAAYSLEGAAATAFAFFAAVSGDAPDACAGQPCSQARRTLDMLEELGRRYLEGGRHHEALALYAELGSLRRGESGCDYRAAAAQAILAERPGDTIQVLAALRELRQAYREHKLQGLSSASTRRCGNAVAALTIEAARGFHFEAVGSPDVAGSGAATTSDAALELYRALVSDFRPGELAAFTFPRLARADWPTSAALRYAEADILFAQGRFAACGEAFFDAYRRDRRGAFALDALVGATACFRRAWSGSPTQVSRTAVAAFDAYACRFGLRGEDREGTREAGATMLTRIEVLRASGDVVRAARAARALARSRVGPGLGLEAAQRYLALVTELDRERGARGCGDELAQHLPGLMTRFCSGADDDDDAPRGCDILAAGSRAATRMRAEEHVEIALGNPKAATGHYRKAAGLVMGLWNDDGRGACRHSGRRCLAYAPLLALATRAFAAAGDHDSAVVVGSILVDRRYHLADTLMAREATRGLAQSYHALGMRERAVQWYERYAEEEPRSDHAPVALAEAVSLRLSLGEVARALLLSRRFDARYAQRHPRSRAQVSVALAEHWFDVGRGPSGERVLLDAMPAIDSAAAFDDKLIALALLGRGAMAVDDELRADGFYRQVLAHGAAGIGATSASHAESRRRHEERVRRATGALAEARFFAAGRLHRESRAIAFPGFRGPPNESAVQSFVGGELARWIEARVAAIRRARAAYREVMLLGGEPVAPWAVAASGATGDLWLELAAELEDIPDPASWTGAPDHATAARLALRDALTKRARMFRKIAARAYAECLEQAIIHQHFGGIERCKRGVDKNAASAASPLPSE